MKLLEPIVINGMQLKNRIVMAPMNLNLGFRSERARAFYTERARGGVGAIIMPANSVDQFLSNELWGRPDGVARFLQGTSLLVTDVHGAGSKVGVQLWHANRFPSGIGMVDTRGEPVAPSPQDNMRALTIAEINSIIEKFGRAAAAAQGAGFDFVEFHGAHYYLPCQFFSPVDNRRSDKYGGSLKGRMQFGLECLKAMRQAVGPDYPIFFRLGAWGDRPGDITTADACQFAVELAKAGADVLDVSVGRVTETGESVFPMGDRPMGTFVHLAEAVRQKVAVPVIAVGRIHTPEVAEAVLVQGKADLVNIGRQLIADPFWPEKVATGRADDIRPCISCNTCIDTSRALQDVRCAVNASAGKEREYVLKPADKPRKVMVIGGGPAGMEVARVAAMRGHQVTLYEKAEGLGGQLLVAEQPPHKQEITKLHRYLTNQLDKTGVEVRLGQEVTAQVVEEVKPDVVVVATGGIPVTPDMPGAGRENVLNAIDVLAGRGQIGRKVVVVGGGMVGCETGEFLTQLGKKVTILEMLEEMGSDILPSARARVLHRLAEANVEMVVKAKAEEITDKGVKATKDSSVQIFKGDTVVLAVGLKPNTELAKELAEKVGNLNLIGDCAQIGKIVDAICDGARVGREI